MNLNKTYNISKQIYPLDELLNSLGILPIDIYIYELVIPIIASIGIVLCITSTWIFSRKTFLTKSPINIYFRIISISYIIQLMFAVSYGLCFAPKYFPSMNSHSCSLVQCAYIPYSGFTSNFNAILDIAILFETIKVMNSLVKKHFTLKPKKMSLIAFLACALFNSIYGLVYVPFYGGDYYYYYDQNNTLRMNSLWYVSSSNIATSRVGSILILVFYLVRDILLTIVTIGSNIYSIYQMRAYFNSRDNLFGQTINLQAINAFQVTPNASLSIQNERRKKSEKISIKLVLTRCFVSLVVRGCVAVSDFYYLFNPDYIATILGAIADLALVVGPTVSFFVFFHFNRDFRRQFFKIISKLDQKFQNICVQTEMINPYVGNSFF